MEVIFFLILGVGAIWLFASFFGSPEKASAQVAFSALDAATPWLASQGISADSVRFSSYTDSRLAHHSGAQVLVGQGKRQQGGRVGFVLEVVPTAGVVLAEFIEPDGIVTHHSRAAQNALMNNISLCDELKNMAREHRRNFSNSA